LNGDFHLPRLLLNRFLGSRHRLFTCPSAMRQVTKGAAVAVRAAELGEAWARQVFGDERWSTATIAGTALWPVSDHAGVTTTGVAATAVWRVKFTRKANRELLAAHALGGVRIRSHVCSSGCWYSCHLLGCGYSCHLLRSVLVLCWCRWTVQGPQGDCRRRRTSATGGLLYGGRHGRGHI
jgi:hypothetical protein